MAARAGRHLLLDKPLALSLPAADAVVDAVRDTGVGSVIFFTRRYTSLVEEFIAKLIRTGGWIGSRTVHFGAIFQPGSPFGESAWRRDRGGLWDVGPHALGTLLPVLGPVTEVYATEGPGQVGYLTARHQAGAVSTLALSVDVPPAAATGNGIQFFGETGLVTVPDEDLDLDRVRGAFGVTVDELLGTIATGTPHRCDVRFGREVVAILTASETSYASGAAVPVDRPGS
jgi:predicted dehydrogenase